MEVTTPDLARARAQAAPDCVESQVDAAYACEAAGLQGQALDYYRRAAALGVPEPQALPFALQFGSALTHSGLWLEAAQHLQRAAERWPEHRGLKCYLALTLHQLGHGAAAMGELLGVVLSLSDVAGDLMPHAWDLAGWEAELLMDAITEEEAP